MFRKALARKKRKEREAAGEIHELNITAMMDMMTIILVFLLKSYAASAISLTQSEDVKPPISSDPHGAQGHGGGHHHPAGTSWSGDRVGGRARERADPARRCSRVGWCGRSTRRCRREVDKLKHIASRNPAAPFSKRAVGHR